MNHDEFAFFNQQLGAMLRDGIPLEGALKQLAAGMRTGPFRTEIQALEGDLAKGTPLKEALVRRNLPDFYKRMVEVGTRSNDLPGVLTLLADHYHRANALWTRLKGLMVYPLLVLLVSLGLTLVLSVLFSRFLSNLFDQFGPQPTLFIASMWIPPLVLGALVILALAALWIPKWRARLRWRLPAFREASLAQLASSIALMLRNGVTLPEALAMAETLEGASPARTALARWRYFVEAGQGKPTQWYRPSPPFPPLFLWLVQKGGEDVGAGFQKAAEIYQARASYRIELALYGALPVSILFLGQMVFWQVAPLMKAMSVMMSWLGDMGNM
ncbi:MAG TPA: type II secretion system F family protein [Candidatus Binatia bacterium]|jgi:type II secretory pathway component PulF|nr:type II secretion system F family protein [Candidatus Binatia bacterium]